MSKIYDTYKKLKLQSDNENTLYLFKYGIFFIFVDEDAKIVSNLLHLKLGQLNDTIVKCGFPINSLEKYVNLLKNTNYQIEIVNSNTESNFSTSEYLYFENLKKVSDEFLKLKIDDLSISQAYDFLYRMQNNLNEIKPR